MLELWSTPEAWVSLLTLAALEIVLGIDNVVFISILADKLPEHQRGKARKLGLGFALLTRLGLLFAITWVMGLTATLFEFMGQAFSGRSLILLGGGLFLMGKSTMEMYHSLEVPGEKHESRGGTKGFAILIIQIMLLDIVFSLDSVITAVGMVDHISIMVVAMIIAMGVMLIFANPIGNFVTRHPTMKILALSFLLLIGVLLVADSFGKHIPKGYIYFAMAFSLTVELINMRLRKNEKPLKLYEHYPSWGDEGDTTA